MRQLQLTLFRRYFSHGTFGELKDANGRLLAVTVECPWENNQKGISCIPEGTYQLQRHVSPSKGDCFAIIGPSHGVTLYGPSQRTHCLIHIANRASELEGCIAPGKRFGSVGDEWAVLSSRQALDELRELIGDNDCTLVIRGQ
ncbi:DUF5675 family protein [Shewanella sp. KCT]|uniref:DUF5675 family protein n=1 Tax=Shewanella sp. KCT TaxID=2569535 RepID=UPI0011832A92|nr:DUF5675 family protein [Shewanella sp. KCT]TVP15379.1 hypothetical protein AYI87_06855 [Shewanella sp. KCT]